MDIRWTVGLSLGLALLGTVPGINLRALPETEPAGCEWHNAGPVTLIRESSLTFCCSRFWFCFNLFGHFHRSPFGVELLKIYFYETGRSPYHSINKIVIETSAYEQIFVFL